MARPAKPAPFVTLEGIDGSGKSSTLHEVAAALAKEGTKVWATREETEGPSGAWARQAVRDGWAPLSTAFLFVADRARHVTEIQARREAGTPVVCDRFVHSTLAYQGVTLEGIVPQPAHFLRALHAGWCPEPDRVLLFDSDPATSVQRTERRGRTTPYEKVAFLEKVRANYLAMAKAEPARFVVLDADQELAGLARDALHAVRAVLG
jgi:dTMP kinase